MNRQQWLESLQIGEIVRVKGGYGDKKVAVIRNITAKKIRVDIYSEYISCADLVCHSKDPSVFFWKHDGYVSGQYLVPCNISNPEQIVKKGDAHQKKRHKWKDW